MADSPIKLELGGALRYLSSLWGLTSGISVLFPSSNVLFDAIPLDRFAACNQLTIFKPRFIAGMATLVSVFFLLTTLSRRHDYLLSQKIQGMAAKKLLNGGKRAFVYAAICIGIYMVLYANYDHCEVGGNEVFGFFAMVLFIGISTYLTLSFTRLGLREYLLEQTPRNSTQT